MRRPGLHKRIDGFTLIEALLAAAILAMTVSAMVVPFAAGQQNDLEQARRTLAVWLAQDLMEEILSKPFYAPDAEGQAAEPHQQAAGSPAGVGQGGPPAGVGRGVGPPAGVGQNGGPSAEPEQGGGSPAGVGQGGGQNPGETTMGDYHGFTEAPGQIQPYQFDGGDEPLLATFSRGATVDYVYVAGQDQAAPPSFCRVIVTVHHDGREMVTLTRLVYANP